MSIDARTTTILFKAKPFWNGFGVFATYEHAQLMNESFRVHMRQQATALKKVMEFEKKLDEAIEFLTRHQQESPLDREVGDEIDRINLKDNRHSFNLVDLENPGILEMLKNTSEMPKREIHAILNRILALGKMSEELTEALNEGVNSFDPKTELNLVADILHGDFDMDVVEERLAEVKKEALSEETVNQTIHQSVEIATELEAKIYQPVYEMVFQAVKKEKQKQDKQRAE